MSFRLIIPLFLVILLPFICAQCYQGTQDSFVKDILKQHNILRAHHGSPAMTLDNSISAQAQQYSDKLAQEKKLVISDIRIYGQNLYFSSGLNPSGSDVVNQWYSEILNYPMTYGEVQFPLKADVNSFTQVIWKASIILGCGVSCDSDSAAYIVCYYSPPGNYKVNGSGYAENVLPPITA